MKNQQKPKIEEFFKLPIKNQIKLMNKVASEANKDQRSLVKKYDKKFRSNK